MAALAEPSLSFYSARVNARPCVSKRWSELPLLLRCHMGTGQKGIKTVRFSGKFFTKADYAENIPKLTPLVPDDAAERYGGSDGREATRGPASAARPSRSGQTGGRQTEPCARSSAGGRRHGGSVFEVEGVRPVCWSEINSSPAPLTHLLAGHPL